MAAKRPQSPVRNGEQQYRLLFDANPCPMYIFDENTLQFLDVNQAALQLYGWSRKAFLQMTAKQIRKFKIVTPNETIPAILLVITILHLWTSRSQGPSRGTDRLQPPGIKPDPRAS